MAGQCRRGAARAFGLVEVEVVKLRSCQAPQALFDMPPAVNPDGFARHEVRVD
jgi:hypothetical protein